MPRHTAFSLLELMTCLGIILLLSALAYPLYENQIARAHRRNAQIQLFKLAQDLEIYRSENGRYSGFSPLYREKNYDFKIVGASEDYYLLKALPSLVQARRDKNCGILSLDNMGKRGISGDGNLNQCWSSGTPA